MSRTRAQALARPVPLHVRISDQLLGEIAAGRYRVGSRLPTEHELCEVHGVSRHTVREALRRLRALGVVSRRQGSGTIVEAPEPPAAYVQSFQSLEDIVQHAKEARLSVITMGVVAVDHRISGQLGGAPGDRWLRVEGVRRVEGRSGPVAWTEIYIHRRFGGIRKSIDNAPRAISALIQARYRQPIVEVRQRISAVAAPANIAAALNVVPGSAALSIVRQYFDAAGEVLLLSLSVHPGDRYLYSMSISKSGDAPPPGRRR